VRLVCPRENESALRERWRENAAGRYAGCVRVMLQLIGFHCAGVWVSTAVRLVDCAYWIPICGNFALLQTRRNVITAQVGQWLYVYLYFFIQNIIHGHYFVWPISSVSSLRLSRPRVGVRRAGLVCTYSEPTGSGKRFWWNETLSLDQCVRLKYPCSGNVASWILGASFATLYSPVVTICTAQWSLYVPHSGQYMYRTVVTICTASLTFTILRSAHTAIFMCFVWVWEQTAIISLYNINWLVFITEI